MLTLLDFRAENPNLVIITPTISMRQNCSISVLADPGGGKQKFENLAHPWHNYDVQSMAFVLARCVLRRCKQRYGTKTHRQLALPADHRVQNIEPTWQQQDPGASFCPTPKEDPVGQQVVSQRAWAEGNGVYRGQVIRLPSDF